MPVGITTARAHITPVVNLVPHEGEIDWDLLTRWLSAEKTPPPPTFAGRYFLGSATQAEVDAGTGFCLWAHGEARGHGEGLTQFQARGKEGDSVIPLKIVPLQRANPDRQSATGDEGLWYGYQDATALARYLDLCLAVGDLDVVNAKQILVFLEVADGTALSVDYWGAWVTALHEALLFPKRPDAQWLQPLLPAILCAFPFDTGSGTFLPEQGVRTCLAHPGRPGFRTRCHGFWARRRLDDPNLATHSFEWSNVGEYRQPQLVAGLALEMRVPLRYFRTFDGPEGWDIADEATRNTMSLVTIDLPATDKDSPLGATFTATDWRSNRTDDAGALVEMPTQLGFDTSAIVSDGSAACLRTKNVVVTSLPYLLEGGGMRVNLNEPCRLGVRYYRPDRGKRLGAPETLALSRNGIHVAACSQHIVLMEPSYPNYDAQWADYVHKLEAPFVNQRGKDDALAVFAYAANTIRQPPYTPIYFSVDFPVDYPYTDGEAKAVRTIGFATIRRYFQDVHRGYREYLATHPSTPYYVGVYANPDTVEDLYREGLVSHFWQTPWGSPFPHLNLWQIGMFDVDPVPADNAALQACAANPSGDFWVDIDVAWGDPGSFQVFP
jgi:hypothetical protein